MIQSMDIKQYRQEILKTFVEVSLAQPTDFLKVKETLTRMGLASQRSQGSPVLYQTAHILHKQGHLYIIHFKQAFLLDGKWRETKFTEDDRARLNLIVQLLVNWNLVQLVSPPSMIQPQLNYADITVVSHARKDEWTLIPKYTIGKKFHGNESVRS